MRPYAVVPACRRRRSSTFGRDERGDVPMRIAPLILVGFILIVLAIIGGALL